jgi:hypothetical protein
VVGGFNTDVRHQDRVLHVQTEVTSRPRPQITTLLFEGGTILHTLKTKLTGKEAGEALRTRMETQHREFIEALKEGSFDAKVGLGREGPEPAAEGRGGLRYFGDGVIGGGRLDEIVLAHLTSG